MSILHEPQGHSFETAIIINEDRTLKGIHAENLWMNEYFPNFQKLGQALRFNEGKKYDIITIKTAEGEIKEIYFDIDNFFGKPF
jgi:hypothetical protein